MKKRYIIMISSEIVQKIENFVYAKPRSIQEIASHLGKNWRTADRYIEEIEKQFGTVAVRVFREGTRGALKIVYWASIEKASKSIFQEQLEKSIFSSKHKEDFSGFDIYQHISEKDKKIALAYDSEDQEKINRELAEFISGAQKQILFFSGNLSFINLKAKNADLFKAIEERTKNGVSVKILCRVDIIGKANIERMLSLNFKHGKEMIEIHHMEQPLRVVIVDGKSFRIKEIKEPGSRNPEFNKKVFMFYTIKNKEWADWLTKVFWKMFSSSLDAQKRLEEINKIRT